MIEITSTADRRGAGLKDDEDKANENAKVDVQFIPLKKNFRVMNATIPVSWNGIKVKFFYQKIHEDSGLSVFPRHPKLFITGSKFEDFAPLSIFVTEVRFSKILNNLLSTSLNPNS